MKLLIALILIVVNSFFTNGLEFANFGFAYGNDQCSGDPVGPGFSLVIGQCVNVFGIVNGNNLPSATNWILTLGTNKKSLVFKQYEFYDTTCRYRAINSFSYSGPDCIEPPQFLFSNNTLLEEGGISNQWSQLTYPTSTPQYVANTVIYGLYNSGNTISCSYDNQLFGISYPPGLTIYNEDSLSISLSCDPQSKDPIMKKCHSNGQCQSNDVFTTCMTSGDVQIYCNPSH